jgi:hypothetical protein
MRHTVKINENAPNLRMNVGELRHHYSEVDFVSSTVSSIVPDGYITGDEFFENVEKKLLNRLKEDGYIQ